MAALLVAIAAGFFFYSRRSQALTEKDSILLTDFVNTTGDSVFRRDAETGIGGAAGTVAVSERVAAIANPGSVALYGDVLPMSA